MLSVRHESAETITEVEIIEDAAETIEAEIIEEEIIAAATTAIEIIGVVRIDPTPKVVLRTNPLQHTKEDPAFAGFFYAINLLLAS